ncbi:aldose 1-epimerase family protein [Novosphingobium sp. JCM 18896]|uniref:aldose 1-epimerase family protein n=1 Tax=Novosphingobium sp. JCM 18896 TaxID=2989731 RepID=UPI0022231567|nr:aldose 1-epimerase family protein [Novosphingobium sp. JCM 18896]MCW1429128.1 aldose 1-epimerase family protein [Novosphingobium sp. JCM 18896]
MTDLITITSGDLTARINPQGAELWSLTDAQGREYMTDADPAFWTGRAPLLFPIVGALNGGHYRLCGSAHELAKHGFARNSRFDCVAADAVSATFRLTASEATHQAYPFPFTLDMRFALEGWTLRMTATVANDGVTDMPFSFGFHPAFAWPLPGGAAKQDHRVTFAQAEPQPIRRIEPPSGLLRPEPQPTPVVGRELTPDAALFEADALIWDDLASRALTYGAPGGASLDIAFPDTPMLGIWQKPGAAYLCIEPWQGIADPQGFADDLRNKPGVVSLAPGAERSFRMDVTVSPG